MPTVAKVEELSTVVEDVVHRGLRQLPQRVVDEKPGGARGR